MPVRIEHLIDATLDSANEAVSANFDFGSNAPPTRVTFYVQIVETQSAQNPTTTLTLEVSPDDGSTLISYDKLITEAGVDGPVSSVAYTATGDDIVSMSLEDVVRYLKLTMTGSADMSGTEKHVVDVWMVWSY